MNINNINFTSFIRVAEAGSFNKAAEDLYITSTALIKQINLLESDLGVRLFDRTHRGLTLTKAGESLYKDARYITDYCREAVERAVSVLERCGASAEFNGKEIKMCTFFKENDKEIYLEMFGNDPILLGKKMAEITLDKIKE